MHPILAEIILEQVQKRLSEGDCPTTERAGRETVEFALIEIARQRDELQVGRIPTDNVIKTTAGFLTQDRLRRDLAIKLGQNVIDAVEAGLQPQNAFKAVEEIWLQEARLDELRKRNERSYL